ncbi:DUF2442 domain-containing protein [Sphingomonas tabacisoli]|uniref:DUF2442 domain-containing protein n=1 Tax=Sphingomonas tabacisoli TaxID=2249466 RepID=A0ABW4HYE2_9SPHN
MSIGKLASAEPQADFVVELAWDDGFKARLNLEPLIKMRPVLKPLGDPAEFARVRLSKDGWSIEWPSGIDFGAPQLRRWATDGFDKKAAA